MRRIEPTPDEVLARLGLDGPYAQDMYVKTVENRFGKAGERFLYAIDDALEEGTPELWQRANKLLNAVPDLSHYVTAHSNTSIYRAMLLWLTQWLRHPPPSAVELGCGNGLFSCCLALTWPDAMVVGIDVVPEAVQTAKILAARLEVPNVSFRRLDLTIRQPKEGVHVPLLAAPFLFHHFLEEDNEVWNTIAENITKALQPEGQLISFDRFPLPKLQRAVLVDGIASTGLKVVHEDVIHVGSERFPVTVFS